jgi:hypothetical protein
MKATLSLRPDLWLFLQGRATPDLLWESVLRSAILDGVFLFFPKRIKFDLTPQILGLIEERHHQPWCFSKSIATGYLYVEEPGALQDPSTWDPSRKVEPTPFEIEFDLGQSSRVAVLNQKTGLTEVLEVVQASNASVA